jgi:(E)-4-hydroxy-3-methylbut-2-enyl-diphosphate synthase
MKSDISAIPSISDLLTGSWGEKSHHQTHEVQIGNVRIGNNNPVAIQSMTNTETRDVQATVQQIIELADAGSELVRVTVNDDEAAQAIPYIKEKLNKTGYFIPIIGDFHYNGHILLSKYPDCAISLDKYRINPGNVGTGKSRDTNFEAIIQIALKNDKPVRIGVNWGSLDRQILQSAMEENAKRSTPRLSQDVMIAAVVASAIRSAKLAEEYGMPSNQIVLSTKMSHVPDMVAAYTLLATNCQYAIHLGLTEAGIGNKGIIASTAALAPLLLKGIGNTIRVSLTPRPGRPRTDEVEICQEILQATNVRRFKPSVTSCPGCGRTTSTLFQEMAQEMDNFFHQRLPEWKKVGLIGIENLHIAVMGCVVNGPGESKNANIGISLPGNGENPRSPVYIDGKLATILEGENTMNNFKKIVDDYVTQYFKPL